MKRIIITSAVVIILLTTVVAIIYNRYKEPVPILTDPQAYEITCIRVRISSDGDSKALTTDQYEAYGEELLNYLSDCKKVATLSKQSSFLGRNVDISIGLHNKLGEATVIYLGDLQYVYVGSEPYIFNIVDAENVQRNVYKILQLERFNLPWS